MVHLRWLGLILVLLPGSDVQAAEILGKVIQAEENRVRVEVSGDRVPDVGDKVAIFHVLAGTDIEASVATGRVTAVDQREVEVEVTAATSPVRKGHSARFASAGKAVSGGPPPTAPRERPAERNPAGSEKVLVEFPFPNFPPAVEEIVIAGAAEDGVLSLKYKAHEADRGLTEGFFVGMARSDLHAAAAEAVLEIALFRAEITEVGTQTAKIRVGPKAFEKLRPGKLHVDLWRPRGLVTAQLRQFPDWALVATKGETVGEAQADLALVVTLNRLRNLAVAMQSFADQHGRLPPAVVYGPEGKPWHSWRVCLLPYLSAEELYREYNLREPWDSPANLRLVKKIPEVYRDPRAAQELSGFTHFAVPVGPQAAFHDDKQVRMEANSDALPRSLGRRLSEADFKDDMAGTILVGCVSLERQIPWTKPEDVPVGDAPVRLGARNGFAAYQVGQQSESPFAFVDGHVQSLGANMEASRLRKLFTIADGERADLTELASPRVSPWDEPERIRIVETPTGPVAHMLFDVAGVRK